ncbi:hypothetical protein [Flavobacterium silvaticum]|uniref:Uncharacterized protein n=1 Tax=Flavobacterium silvaticum TaxID=1852020 RepID=A0A972FVR3_9FLAO|nr:hypothetical protein [Flavobacterium silvaticum]NMH28505.1 hypothetical protein [Flavobacterium silvaticum]
MKEIKLFIGLILFLIALFFLINQKNDQEREKEENINKHRFITVGKLKKKGRHHTDYVYYYDGKKYIGTVKSPMVGKSQQHKYFYVSLSTVNPELSRIDLSGQIIDTAQIHSSGFREKTMTEILNDTMSAIND